MPENQDPYTELFDRAQKEKNNQACIAENMRRLIREIYEKRERKIINMALDKSRTKTFLIDTTALLDEEKKMFETFVAAFDKFRDPKLKPILSVHAKEEIGVEINEKQLITA